MIKEFQNEYRWLSNFAPVNIILNGLTFGSVEHAYMSAKSDESSWKETCSNSLYTAGQIKKLSKGLKLKSNWEAIKVSVMEECLRQKFNQNHYKAKLIKTKDEHIQEGNMWGDKFWGVCLKTNKGENNLGQLIMKIRSELNA